MGWLDSLYAKYFGEYMSRVYVRVFGAHVYSLLFRVCVFGWLSTLCHTDVLCKRKGRFVNSNLTLFTHTLTRCDAPTLVERC